MTTSMEEAQRTAGVTGRQVSRFELAPPRHFLFPAILLLLSEEPGYGYGLVKDLRAFRFGAVDRPSVYRALAQLEGDGLVESWSAPATAGQPRRIYGLTSDGERALRTWMGVIQEERSCLDEVLRRYQATGTVDAALAEVEGVWAAHLGPDWSPVSSTSRARGRLAQGVAALRLLAGSDPDHEGAGGGDLVGAPVAPDVEPAPVVRRFEVIAERSVLLIEARSSVGPISFGAVGLTGHVDAEVDHGTLTSAVGAHLEVAVDQLRSGNSLYDAELSRRIDARRFPRVALDLEACNAIGTDDRYRLAGRATFHGVTKPVEGIVRVHGDPERKLVVTGEHVFDIRDFDLASPTVLMLRIYPDVRVRLQLEAEALD